MARMYYALQSVQTETAPVYGVQSIGASSQGDQQPVFQLGQLGAYGAYTTEDNPVEVTISKQLDGRSTLYESFGSAGFQFNFWTNAGEASGVGSATPTKSLVFKNPTLSSLTYTFEVDGVASEELTMIGDHLTDTGTYSVVYMDPTKNEPTSLATRANVKEIRINNSVVTGFESVSISWTKNIESLYELGRFRNTERYITYPTEVTVDLTQNVTSMDALGSANTETNGDCAGSTGGLGNNSISIELCDGYKITIIGTVETSTSYQGGDTSGAQLQLVRSFTAWDGFSAVRI